MKFEIEPKYKIGDTIVYGTAGRIVDIRLFQKNSRYIIQYRIKFDDMTRIWFNEDVVDGMIYYGDQNI